MIIKRILFILCIVFSSAHAQDKIQGTYSYTYGDNESLVEARQTCKDLALREAIESYSIFIESSTAVENFQTKEDIIESISAGYLQDVTVTEQKEEGRTITITVEALVSPEEVKTIIDQLVTDQQEELSEQDSTQSAEDDIDNKMTSDSDHVSRYESKLTLINVLQKQNKLQDAVRRIIQLKSYLKKNSPEKNNQFQWQLYKVNYQYISLLEDFLKYKDFKKDRNRLKAAQSIQLIRVKRTSLQNALNNLEKYENISEKEKNIKRNTLKRGYNLLDKIRQEVQIMKKRR